MKTICARCHEKNVEDGGVLCDKCRQKIFTFDIIKYTDDDLILIRTHYSVLMQKHEDEKDMIEDYINLRYNIKEKKGIMIFCIMFTGLAIFIIGCIGLNIFTSLLCAISGGIALFCTTNYINYRYKTLPILIRYEKELKITEETCEGELTNRKNRIKTCQEYISNFNSLEQARNFEKSMRLEDAAQIYEKLGYYDKAGELRRKEVKKHD